jgi:DNA mismatch endonuclease (patch repair protein)
MVDTVHPSVRSRMMGAVKGRNTTPEVAVRHALHAAGYRFRLHRGNLPGKPDIVLPRPRVVGVVHGCFWHGHDCRRGRRPSSNVEFWDAKLARNVERDHVAARALVADGWYVVTIWECGLEVGIANLLGRLSAARAAPAS